MQFKISSREDKCKNSRTKPDKFGKVGLFCALTFSRDCFLYAEKNHTKRRQTLNGTQMEETHTEFLKQFQIATVCMYTHTLQSTFDIKNNT